MSDFDDYGGNSSWHSISSFSRDIKRGEDESLWQEKYPRRSVDPPRPHCLKCGFGVEVTRVGSTLAWFEPGTTELHQCRIKPRLSFGRVEPRQSFSLKIGGKRVDV